MENTKHPQVHIVILILIKELIFYKMDLAIDEKQKQTDCCTLWMQSSATPPASHKKDIHVYYYMYLQFECFVYTLVLGSCLNIMNLQ